MKKLLFVIPEYSHGGTNKSLENLLSLIDKRKYDISIYCLYEDGGDYYKRQFAPYILKKSRLYYWLHDNVCTRKLMGLWNKVTKRDNFTWLYKREARYIQEKYGFDVVVAYQEGTATEFVSYMRNVRKVAWIHCDYGAWIRNVRREDDAKCYSIFNAIVCVSECARHSFCASLPNLSDRSYVINNLLDINEVNQKEKEQINEDWNGQEEVFRVLSVGRLSMVKQFSLIPAIVRELKDKVKRTFQWYIIGSGDAEMAIREEIIKYQVEDIVILMGSKDNPYPYMHKANLLVSTSISESYPYVVLESKVLHTPVLSNDFPSALEVVNEGCGWIVNIKDMPEALARIIDNMDGEYDQKKRAAMEYEYSNESVLKKIDLLFNDNENPRSSLLACRAQRGKNANDYKV